MLCFVCVLCREWKTPFTPLWERSGSTNWGSSTRLMTMGKTALSVAVCCHDQLSWTPLRISVWEQSGWSDLICHTSGDTLWERGEAFQRRTQTSASLSLSPPAGGSLSLQWWPWRDSRDWRTGIRPKPLQFQHWALASESQNTTLILDLICGGPVDGISTLCCLPLFLI